jgi:hypothetical protein
VHGNAHAGIYVEGSNPTIASSAIYGNGGPGLVTYNSQPRLRGNLFHRNRGFGIRNDTPSRIVDARHQAWGHPTGPHHPTLNPLGLGQRVSDGVDFAPWQRTSDLLSGVNPPQAVVISPAVDGYVYTALPLQFQILITDVPTSTAVAQDALYLRAEIRRGEQVVAVYDQLESATGWDQAVYEITGEPVTATLNLTQSLPAGEYTIQVTTQGVGTSRGPARRFEVNLGSWGIASVQPEEILSIPELTQTLRVYGDGFTAGMEVWLEQVITETTRERVEVAVTMVSTRELELKAEMGGLSGLWDIVVRRGGEEKRQPLYVFPYMPVMVLESVPPDRVRPNIESVYQVKVANAGTAEGVALIAAAMPTGTQVLTVTGGIERVWTEGEMAIFAIRVAPEREKVAAVRFVVPWGTREGGAMFMNSEQIGLMTVEGWEYLRAEMEEQTAPRMVVMGMSGWMMLEGHYLERFIEQVNWQRRRAQEWWERLHAQKPVMATMLGQAVFNMLIPGWYEAFGYEHQEVDQGLVDEWNLDEGRLAATYSGTFWDEVKLHVDTFKEMFSPEGFQLMGTSLKAVGTGVLSGLTFGLLDLKPVPNVECEDEYTQMAVRWGKAAGEFAATIVNPFSKLKLLVKVKLPRLGEKLAQPTYNVSQRLLQYAVKNHRLIASSIDRGALFALETLQRLDGMMYKLTSRNPQWSRLIQVSGRSNDRDIVLFNKYRVKLVSRDKVNTRSPATNMLGISKIVKTGDTYKEVNIVQYAEWVKLRGVTYDNLGNITGVDAKMKSYLSIGGSGGQIVDPKTGLWLTNGSGNVKHSFGSKLADDNVPLLVYGHDGPKPSREYVEQLRRKMQLEIDVIKLLKRENPFDTSDEDNIYEQAEEYVAAVRDLGEEFILGAAGYAGSGNSPDCNGSRSNLVAAFDPNDILGLPERRYINTSQELEFIIRFENVPSATAEAERVAVTTTLDADLDWSSVQIVDSSHPSHLSVQADEGSRTLVWVFNNINLQPNRTPPEGEGWVRYRVRPKSDLRSGTEITAQAVIVFDANPPIWTNVVTYVIDVAPPVTPTVVTTEAVGGMLRVNVRGEDRESGISYLAVSYRREGEARWQRGGELVLREAVTEVNWTLEIGGLSGGRYEVMAYAVDDVGLSNESEIANGRVLYRSLLPVVRRPLVELLQE